MKSHVSISALNLKMVKSSDSKRQIHPIIFKLFLIDSQTRHFLSIEALKMSNTQKAPIIKGIPPPELGPRPQDSKYWELFGIPPLIFIRTDDRTYETPVTSAVMDYKNIRHEIALKLDIEDEKITKIYIEDM